MKYIKPNNHLIYIANPLFFLLGIYLFWHYSLYIPTVFKAFWITVLLALLLIITPRGSIYLSLNHDEIAKRISRTHWFFRIILLELVLLGSFAGICLVSGQILPIEAPTHFSLFSQFIKNTLIVGLFPWPLYALITVGMCVLAYRKQIDAYTSNLLEPFLNNPLSKKQKEIFSLIVNVGARRCTIFIFGISMMFLAFLEMSLLISLKKHLIYGFQTPALITTLMLFLLVYSKKVKQYINRFFSRKITTALGIPLFCLMFGMSIFLINTLTTGSIQNISADNTTIPPLIQSIVQMNWQTSWIIFSYLWWLCLTIPVCSYFADISKGYRIREVILSINVLPIIIGLSILFLNHHPINWSFMISPELIKILALISFFILLPLLINHQTSSNVIMAYFPKNGIIKHRDHLPFFQKTIQTATISLYFYFVLGMNGLSLLLFAMMYLIVIISLITAIAVVKNIL